jgi:hypothetical protein
MIVLAFDRWRGFVGCSRTKLGQTIQGVQHRNLRDRLQGQHVCRNNGEEPPQYLT